MLLRARFQARPGAMQVPAITLRRPGCVYTLTFCPAHLADPADRLQLQLQDLAARETKLANQLETLRAGA